MLLSKKMMGLIAAGLLGVVALTGCAGNSSASESEKQVVIYTNADDEAVAAMENALNTNGFEGKYILQGFGTSELGGKLLAEGTNIEADLLTMSSYYLDSAQEQNEMFSKLTFPVNTLSPFPEFYAPITSQEGAIIVNTELMKEKNLPMPTSIKDLGNPVYKDMISVTDINSSSTAWLLVQAVADAYGTGEEGVEVMRSIFANAGPHIESSGSAPLKKARAGEVAIGFGLRHQAVADKEKGLPIDYVDPTEGNFSLTESVAVVDKGENTNPMAMDMAKVIIENSREEILKNYPNVLYDGETSNSAHQSKYPKTFPEPLTTELLQKHIDFSDAARALAE